MQELGERIKGRALIVEDNVIVAMEAESLLLSLGASEVKSASNTRAALAAIEKHAFDYAMIDVNLGEESGLEVAQALVKKGVPFIFTTGYGEDAVMEKGFPEAPLVLKPYGTEALSRALSKL